MTNFFKSICLFTCVIFAANTQAQIINIPDTAFKAWLLRADITNNTAKDSSGNNIKIDINGNNEIEQNECLFVAELFLESKAILSLIGIDNFINLKRLNCSNNRFTSLDLRGLVNLKFLRCWGNRMNDLNINGLINLESLDCGINQLTNLNVNGLLNLRILYCSNNQLTLLNLNELIKLQYLNISANNFTSINLNGLSYLQLLNCQENNLRTLDVSGLPNLQDLSCGGNQLTSLNLGSTISTLSFFGNQLTSLNLSGLDLFNFECYNTPLTSIYMKNNVDNSNVISSSYYIEDNPSLEYVCADDIELNALEQLLNINDSSNIFLNSFCSSTLNGVLNNLHGNTKLDIDNNGCTSHDSIYQNLKIKINNTINSGYIFADAQGNFALDLDSGTYTLTPELLNNYFSVSPASTTITLPEDTIPQQFCITPNGTHHDVSVSIIPIRSARPGFSDATYKIVLRNKGNQIENGTILFNYEENLQDYISSTLTPSNIQSGQLSFTFSNLQLFETREIIVTMRTNAPTDNPAVNAGDVIQLSVTANLDNGVRDEFFKDNFQNIKQTVIGSFDPNDKTCLEGNIITPALVGDFVHYLIRFENTGTANAENVVVTDFIDLNTFDISTLEITSTSHNCKTLISNGNKVQFVFDNINLPFTEPLKHGYVAFKLKLKNNLGIGDSLKNKADIYFDYNLPITTNIAASRIDNVTAIKTNANKDGSLSVYPNPGNGNFTVNFESPVRQTIIVKIVAINGNVVYEQNLYHNYQSQLQLNQNLPAGVYLITVNSEKEQYTQKLIITK